MKLTGLEQSIFDNFLVEHLEVQPSVSLHKKKTIFHFVHELKKKFEKFS